MKKIYLFLILISCLVSAGTAQELCGTDALHEYMMQNDATYRSRITNMQKQVRAVIQNRDNLRSETRSVTYILPVVVHVIHLGESVGTGSNIADVQIMSAITGLNTRWSNSLVSIDMEVEFCLASMDPDGNATSGINRVDGSAIPGYFSGINLTSASTCGGAIPDDVKDLSRWPVLDYYNIWVVSDICEGYAGYATYPYGGDYDGAVVKALYFVGTSNTTTHELGHGFSLRHTFEGDGGNQFCPSDGDCLSEGDFVCDTKPHMQTVCGTTNSCLGSGDWNNTRSNFMSYCSGVNKFTLGQKEQVQATLLISPRAELLLNNICFGSGVNEDLANTSFSVSPNPATSELTVQSSEFGKISSFEIYNTVGEQIYQKRLTSNQQHVTISIADFTPGIYFITVTNQAGNKVTKKVVKM